MRESLRETYREDSVEDGEPATLEATRKKWKFNAMPYKIFIVIALVFSFILIYVIGESKRND